MKYALYLLSALFSVLSITSCISDEDFPTPAGATFRLSVDTIDFDTVITHTASATRTLTLYNDNSDGLSITSVTIEGEDAAQFLANVDGTSFKSQESGDKSQESNTLDCRGKDSLIAFVQFNAKDIDRDEAALSEARLVFTLANGKRQSIVLQGYSLDAIELRGKVYRADATLAATRPYVVYDSLVVAEGATLTLAAGTTLLMRPEAYIKVKGTLLAEGTLEQPVTVRGHRLDDMFKRQPYDRIDNQWQGITFTATSYGNRLNYCDIHSSNYGVVCDSSDVSHLKLTIENTVLHNAKQNCLTLTSTQAFIGNSQITNAEGNCVTIHGGDQQFVHCTIASFSPFIAMRGNALVFSNTVGSYPCPLRRMDIINSIVTGYATDEIFGNPTDDKSVPFNYTFRSSLLCTPEINTQESSTEGQESINNAWEEPKDSITRARNFIPFDLPALYFDFSLRDDSKARGLADPDITARYYPLDRLGRRRTPTADAGCYQYSEEE